MAGEDKTLAPQEFLQRYREGVKALADAYRQVQIDAVYTISNVPTKAQRSTRRVLMQDGENYKVVTTYQTGLDKGTQDIYVANPERSFVLGRDDGGSFIRSLSRRNQQYNDFQDDVISRSHLVRAPYSYFEMPIIDYLCKKEATIDEVKSETASGRRQVRVLFHVLPWSDQMREGRLKHTEGWFLLDPEAHWASLGFKTKDVMSDGDASFSSRETITYGKPEDGIPIVSHAKIEHSNKSGVYDIVEAEVKSVRFTPTDSTEFTLKGCGFLDEIDDADPFLPRIFFWSLALAFVALVGVLVFRWRFRKSVVAPAVETPAKSATDEATGFATPLQDSVT
jgi:hypothetical protein